MYGRNKQTLGSWITEAMVDEDKGAMIRGFTVVHCYGESEREIHTVVFGDRQYDPNDLAKMLRHKADTFCQELSGVQSCAVLAFYGNSKEPEARYNFKISGLTAHDGDGTEAPDGKGLTQQGMRHLEVATQMMLRQTAIVMDAANEMNSRLMKRLETAEEENREAYMIVKELVLEKNNNHHKLVMEQKAFDRSSKEREKWLAFAPTLINTILNREVFPQSVADSSLIDAVADALSPADIQKIAGVLPPTLWGPLAARFEKVIKEKTEVLTAEKQLMEKGVTDEISESN